MELLYFSTDLIRLVFVIGAILALVYKKTFGVTPGGVIVPGVLAIQLAIDKAGVVITIVTALISFLLHQRIVHARALSHQMANYIIMATTIVTGSVAVILLKQIGWLDPVASLTEINIVTAGLIAISMRKYSALPVLRGTIVTSLATYLLGSVLITLIPFAVWTQTSVQLAGYPTLGVDNAAWLIPIGLAISFIVFVVLRIKPAGYLLLPYLVIMLANSPLQTALTIASIIIIYYGMTIVLRITNIFGLERFVITLIMGYLAVSIMDIIAIHITIPGYRTSGIIGMTIIAVATNSLLLLQRNRVQSRLQQTATILQSTWLSTQEAIRAFRSPQGGIK